MLIVADTNNQYGKSVDSPREPSRRSIPVLRSSPPDRCRDAETRPGSWRPGSDEVGRCIVDGVRMKTIDSAPTRSWAFDLRPPMRRQPGPDGRRRDRRDDDARRRHTHRLGPQSTIDEDGHFRERVDLGNIMQMHVTGVVGPNSLYRGPAPEERRSNFGHRAEHHGRSVGTSRSTCRVNFCFVGPVKQRDGHRTLTKNRVGNWRSVIFSYRRSSAGRADASRRVVGRLVERPHRHE